MGADTIVIVPTGTRAVTQALLRDHPELDAATTRFGADFLALYQGERFSEVRRDPELWGLGFARLLPARIRRKLDRRGLLVVPDVGQAFAGATYEALAADSHATWLPVLQHGRRQRKSRLLLVHLSDHRRERVIQQPELVREIVAARTERPIPQACATRPASSTLAGYQGMTPRSPLAYRRIASRGRWWRPGDASVPADDHQRRRATGSSLWQR